MRNYLFVALLATTLYITAEARQLTQDAYSNSNGCLTTIPMCQENACVATVLPGGTAGWKCLRCRGNYDPVLDSADNIIQCVCPRGFYENTTNSVSTCMRCPLNSWCPGGDRVATPTSRGLNNLCGTYMVTRTDGARTQADCLAKAGYARTTPQSATVCDVSEYAPLYNRLSKCLKCQSGLQESPNDNLQLSPGSRNSKRTVCKLPPGRFMSQGLVRACPQGFFREKYVDFDNANGTVCLSCNPGVTTAGASSGFSTDCNIVQPGYGLANFTTLPAAASLPTASATPNGLPAAFLCDIGYYSNSSVCLRCDKATVTMNKGAVSAAECMVPPGYYLPSNSDMAKCTNGTFRAGWIMASDPKAANCTPCGDGIYSELRDADENPLAPANTNVASSPSSCYIEAGFGMIAQGNNLFMGKECPVNTYGAAGKVYGWVPAPCKPCPRNMITDGKIRVSNMSECVNDDGFGMASEGASRCAPGFWSAKGSLKPCEQCPAGRTTADDKTKQKAATDCYVKEGYGVVNSTANATDAFNFNTAALPIATLAALPVLECPIGYFGSDYGTPAVGRKCLPCPAGATTQEPGRVNIAQCDVCSAGYGKDNSTAPCAMCGYGFYSAGLTADTCKACPVAKYYLPVGGGNVTFTSIGWTTYPGAFGEEVCVSKTSQMSPEAGQAFVPNISSPAPFTLAHPSNDTMDKCINACDPPNTKLCFAQFDTLTKQCAFATLVPILSTSTSAPHLVYKLPPSSVSAASSVKPGDDVPPTQVGAKTMPSGYYAHGAIDSPAWSALGYNLVPDSDNSLKFSTVQVAMKNVPSVKDCKKLCDNSNICWGFVWTPVQLGAPADGNTCNFRGGIDATNSVAFFDMPTSAGLAAFQW